MPEVEQAVIKLKTVTKGTDVDNIQSLTINLDLLLELAGSFLGPGGPNPGAALSNPDAKRAPFYGIKP